ncbi:DcrB-related protein [Pseudomonas graminis]|uniref:Cytoplasmic protein n=1 Tax=Pseudomonas graminis TaxID=158627 RepID=A0A1C2E0R8_9PSED|nr:DcrB-related protein [Pseudomonas graminis]OCX20525.1 cytoplasmic protein [Pseudomonas graminis]
MRTSMYDRISEKRIAEERRLEAERLEQERLANLIPKPHERFQTNELSFVRPESFKDKTFHVFTLTDLGPSPFSLVIGRSVVAVDTDLETVAQQLLAELNKTLAHLEWVEPLFPTEVAGVDARQVEFKWRQQGQPVHQLQLIFLHRDEHEQPLLMQITGTSNNPAGMTPAEREAFASIVETLELRTPPSPDDAHSGEAASV